MAANSMRTEWSQVEGQPKNVCSVVEMHMLGEGHMLGSRGEKLKMFKLSSNLPSAAQARCLVRNLSDSCFRWVRIKEVGCTVIAWLTIRW